MTASDAPQPPGGPLRQDGAEGGFAAGEERTGTDGSAGADGSERQRTRPSEGGADAGGGSDSVPPVVHGRPEQSEAAQAAQEENAETSLDQPSS